MRSHTWALFATVCSAAAPALASTVVVPEQDYYSWQVSSASTPEKLQAVYQEYVELPYVRLERRGSLYVVRVGFWKDRQTAEASGICSGFLARSCVLQASSPNFFCNTTGNWHPMTTLNPLPRHP